MSLAAASRWIQAQAGYHTCRSPPPHSIVKLRVFAPVDIFHPHFSLMFHTNTRPHSGDQP